MRKTKLTKREEAIERDLLKGEYRPVGKAEFENIARAINRRKKDTVLNIRVNRQDLIKIKRKAKRLGVKYQTFLSELLHRFAA